MQLNSTRLWLGALALTLLAACSGGAPTTQNPNTTDPTVKGYSGPAPRTADVQAFRVNLWDNINGNSRCGSCHSPSGGQAPMFARPDDVNLAYDAALPLVNLSQPDQSHLVAKVGGGHHCWLSSDQSCADIMTVWIKNWAGGASAGGTQIQLVAPVDKTVGDSKTFPTSSALFGQTVWPKLTEYCARCHSSGAAVPQSPFFASSDVNEAYAAAKAKINLDNPAQSRFVVRLRDEFHNCFGTPVNCTASANEMLDAINSFVNGIVPTAVDPALVLSKALTIYDGTIASGATRFDTGIIARYQFKEGTGAVADDTSGVDPAMNLDIAGDVSWVGGWGLRFGPNGGAAKATTAASRKLYNKLSASGAYSVELWAAPANVTQEDAYVASYSGGVTSRNFTVSQHAYQYELFGRSSATDGNGAPALLTKDTDRDAQASLQHVVMVYDGTNGRRLYVNGNFTGDLDARTGGSLGNWDDTFAFLLGNETSNDRKWVGTVRFAAIYDRALTLDQVQQNFAAGVGERYYLLFNVSDLTGMAQSYVMFEVSRYDSYSYLFNKPVFISLNASATPPTIPIKGLRIGINGREAPVGQAYATLNTQITPTNYTQGAGQRLADIGTVIALEKGPDQDLFFLSFEQIGSATNVHTEPTPTQPAPPADVPRAPDMGSKVFSEINASMAEVTGVPTTNGPVRGTYLLVEQQLPTVPALDGVLASHQIGVAQLAIQYCDALVESTQAASFFPGLDLNSSPSTAFGTQAGMDSLINPLIAKGVGTGLGTQPSDAELRTELGSLISNLSSCGAACPTGRTRTIAKAACAAVLGSATTLIK